MKGNSSFNNPNTKKSFKLDFEEFKDSNEVDGLKQLNLNNGFKDPTFLREKLNLDFCEFFGLPAPRCDYARLFVNGQPYAFYMLVEEVDKTFCKTRFGNKGGNLFKGDPHGDLKWKGTTVANYYPDYELKTNEDANDWTDIVGFINAINNTPINQLNDSLDPRFNTEMYVKQWAATQLFSNLDSYTGSGHNYYIYHNTETDRFEWIAWDVNEAFGVFNPPSFGGGDLRTLPLNFLPSGNAQRPLNQKMVTNTIYFDQMKYFVCQAITSFFNDSIMGLRIDSLYDRIKTDVYADTRKFYSSSDFDTNIDTDLTQFYGLKPFVNARVSSLQQQLNGVTCEPFVSIGKEPVSRCTVMPNPFHDKVILRWPEAEEQNELVAVFDLMGQPVFSILANTGRLEIDTQLWPAGYYQLKAGNQIVKLVKW